jgi:hypothetical protein
LLPSDVYAFSYGGPNTFKSELHVDPTTPGHWYGIQVRWNNGQTAALDFNTNPAASASKFIFKGETWIFAATTYRQPTDSIAVLQGYYGKLNDPLKVYGNSENGFTGSNPDSVVQVCWSQCNASNVMMWNRELSYEEVNWLYNSGSGRYLSVEPGQMVYFKEGNSLLVTKVIEDQSSNGVSGSLSRTGYLTIPGEVIESPSMSDEFKFDCSGNLYVRNLDERWI